jgi:hypothetical protein
VKKCSNNLVVNFPSWSRAPLPMHQVVP